MFRTGVPLRPIAETKEHVQGCLVPSHRLKPKGRSVPHMPLLVRCGFLPPDRAHFDALRPVRPAGPPDGSRAELPGTPGSGVR